MFTCSTFSIFLQKLIGNDAIQLCTCSSKCLRLSKWEEDSFHEQTIAIFSFVAPICVFSHINVMYIVKQLLRNKLLFNLFADRKCISPSYRTCTFEFFSSFFWLRLNVFTWLMRGLLWMNPDYSFELARVSMATRDKYLKMRNNQWRKFGVC